MNIRTIHSLRAALACCVTFLIAVSLHLPYPFWSILTVIVLLADFPEQAIRKGVLRIIATILGALIGILCTTFLNYQAIYITTLFFISAYGCYMTYRSKYPYIWILGGATAFIVMISATVNPNQVLHIALWRSVEISLGVFVATLFNVFLFPNPLEQAIENSLHNLLISLAEKLEELSNSYKSSTHINTWEYPLDTQKKCKELLRIMTSSSKRFKQFDLYTTIFNEIDIILMQLSISSDYFIDSNDEILIDKLAIINWLEDYTAYLRSIELISISAKKNLSTANNLSAQFNMIMKSYQNFRYSGQSKKIPVEIAIRQASIMNQLAHLNDFIQAIENPQKNIDESEATLMLHATTRKTVIQHAIRVGVVSVLTFYIWQYSGWYAGMIGIVSAYVVSLEGTTIDTATKSAKRFLGCLLGSALGLIAVSFLIHSLLSMLICLFLSMYLFSYFVMGSTKVSYAGLQGAVAYIIATTASNSMMITTIGPSLERLAGIYMGVIVALVVSLLLWPTHPKAKYRETFSLLLNYLQKFLSDITKNDIQSERKQLSHYLLCLKNFESYSSLLKGNDNDKQVTQLRLAGQLCQLIEATPNKTMLFTLYNNFDSAISEKLKQLCAQLENLTIQDDCRPASLNFKESFKQKLQANRNSNVSLQIRTTDMLSMIKLIDYLDLMSEVILKLVNHEQTNQILVNG